MLLKNNNIVRMDDKGFTVVEALIGLTIFSLMFTALTAGIWSATSTLRVSSYADESIINAQDVIEMFSVIEINDVTGNNVVIERGVNNEQKIRYSILNPDLTGDFKTIAVEVFHSEDAVLADNELRMRTYYRRMVY